MNRFQKQCVAWQSVRRVLVVEHLECRYLLAGGGGVDVSLTFAQTVEGGGDRDSYTETRDYRTQLPTSATDFRTLSSERAYEHNISAAEQVEEEETGLWARFRGTNFVDVFPDIPLINNDLLVSKIGPWDISGSGRAATTFDGTFTIDPPHPSLLGQSTVAHVFFELFRFGRLPLQWFSSLGRSRL